MITRFTAEERKRFEHMANPEDSALYVGKMTEPALGTVDERLGIIIRRQGGRSRVPTATQAERNDYEAWRERHAPDSTPLYPSKP